MSNIQFNSNATSGYGTPLIPFQLSNASIKEKSNFTFGEQLAKYIESTVNGGTSSYFFVRNQRFRLNRNYASGKLNMQRFMDLLEFNGKDNYINLNWLPIHIVNRIISGLVGRWMQRNEKINVTAIDSLSEKQKQDQFDEIEFIIENREMLEKLQAESGVQMIPNDQSLPSDKEQLLLWKMQFQRLPEEIGYEMGCNDVLGSCGWFDTLKEKMLHDSAITGLVGTYTWMDTEGVIHVEWLKPENCFYSYSSFPDFRDTTWRGYMRTMKISELRKKYSKEFHPENPNAISEEDLFNMAKSAKEYQFYDNISWNTEWNVTFLRPYDEWNIDVMEFELKTVDTESYTAVTTKNGSTIIKKGKGNKRKENERYIDDSKINIYRGVYARTTMRMLEWGLKKNMIRPQDPKEIGNAEFSYSFYMVQSYDMTCLGIPEKIQEPADQMIIARLKIQQLVAKMIPAGAAVNWDAISQSIDYGLGEANKSIDVVKMFEQTGRLYYRGRDAEGNPLPVPYVEMPNAGFYNQLRGLIELYQFHYNVMKDELGEDPNLISQAIQPRVTAENVEVSQQQAENATNYYYDAYKRVMEDTARKICCLLKDSVEAGATVYKHIVGEDEVKNRIFTSKVQLLPTAIDLQKFELQMQKAMDTTPELALFIDPMQMMRVAKEDIKLAESLYRQGTKKMILWKQQTAAENTQATIDGQIRSAQEAEKSKQETEALKGDVDVRKSQVAAQANNQTAVLNLVATLLKPSGDGLSTGTIPPDLKPLVNAVIDNVMVGAIAGSEEQKAKILEQIQAAREQQQPQQQMTPEQQNQQPQQNQIAA